MPAGVGTAAVYSCPYLWWLCGHLDAGLQDGDGEVWVGAGAEPEAEGRVWILHLQLLLDDHFCFFIRDAGTPYQKPVGIDAKRRAGYQGADIFAFCNT